MSNYHKILGVSPSATQEEIAKAYKKMALKYHPDKNRGNEVWAKQEFIKVSEAYGVLSGKTKPESSNKFSSDAKFKEFEEMFNEVKREFDETRREFDEYKENKRQEEEKTRSEAIRSIEENLTSSNVSISELDSSLWSPYSDWKEKLKNSVSGDLDVFIGDMKIAINKVKWKKINANNNNSGKENYTHNNYDYSKENFGKNGKGEGNYDKGQPFTSNPSEYIKALEEKIEIYRERILKTSDEGEKQKYWEKINGFKKEIEILKNQSSSGSNDQSNQNSNNSNNDSNKNDNEKTSENTTIEDNIKSEQTQKNNEYNEILNQTEKPDATLEEKAEAIKKSGSMVGEETPEQQSRREKLEEELAEQNPELANQTLLGRIENNLKANNLTLEELPPEIQSDYQKVKDDKDIAARINDSISEVGAKKMIESLKKEVNNLTKASSDKKIKELKEKLLKIIYGNNRYHQKYKQEAQSLLSKLENRQTQNPSDSKFPIGWVVGSGIILLIGLGLATSIIARNRRKKKFIKK